VFTANAIEAEWVIAVIAFPKQFMCGTIYKGSFLLDVNRRHGEVHRCEYPNQLAHHILLIKYSTTVLSRGIFALMFIENSHSRVCKHIPIVYCHITITITASI
jgi:hypothetical protein